MNLPNVCQIRLGGASPWAKQGGKRGVISNWWEEADNRVKESLHLDPPVLKSLIKPALFWNNRINRNSLSLCATFEWCSLVFLLWNSLSSCCYQKLLWKFHNSLVLEDALQEILILVYLEFTLAPTRVKYNMDKEQLCFFLDDNLIALKHHISLGLRDGEGEEGWVEIDIMPITVDLDRGKHRLKGLQRWGFLKAFFKDKGVVGLPQQLLVAVDYLGSFTVEGQRVCTQK